MEDIFDIKFLNFAFLFSYEYLFLLWLIVFFGFYYLVAVKYFSLHNSQKKEVEYNPSSQEINENEQRIQYLEKHIWDFDRGLFYREVGLFLRKCMFDIFWENQIYFMTATELVSRFPSKYQSIFFVVYKKEFDAQSEDSLEVRKEILQKIREITQ